MSIIGGISRYPVSSHGPDFKHHRSSSLYVRMSRTTFAVPSRCRLLRLTYGRNLTNNIITCFVIIDACEGRTHLAVEKLKVASSVSD